MQLPPIPQPGKPLEATWGERVIDYLKSLTPGSSPTVQAIHLKGGCTYHAKPGKGGAAEIKPFQLFVSSAVVGEATVPKIRVAPSTLAGGNGTDLGFAEGDDPQYLLTPAAGILAGGIFVEEDGTVSSRWLEIIPALDFEASDGEGSHYVAIGTVGGSEEEGWTVSNFRFGPIEAFVCGVLVNWY